MFVLVRQVMQQMHTIGVFSSLEKAKKAGIHYVKIESREDISYCIYQHTINKTSGPQIGHFIGSIEMETGSPVYYSHMDPKPLVKGKPLIAFAYDVLNGDPIACDAVRDILKV